MVTEIAPMDMLLQRIGRLWRHPTNDNKRPCIHPECIILHPSMEDAEKNVIAHSLHKETRILFIFFISIIPFLR